MVTYLPKTSKTAHSRFELGSETLTERRKIYNYVKKIVLSICKQ